MRNHVLAAVLATLTPVVAAAAPTAPTERRLHSNDVDASSFLWNDWNKFVENYHPNYVADDDPATAWVEGSKTSGAGEQLRIRLTPLDATTGVRLRIRNGYQKSKPLFAANARAREVTVRLLPSKVEVRATLADRDGWQELAITQPSGPMRAVELDIRSVYEGTRYTDLAISDVQVFATSATAENPAFEKGKRVALLTWRTARMSAAKLLAGKARALPLYTAYEVTTVETKVEAQGPSLAAAVAAATAEPALAEWKDALATARELTASPGALTRAQLAPRTRTPLVAVDGLAVPGLDDAATEGWYDTSAIRLPMRAQVSSLFADQLRVLDIKDTLTIEAFGDLKKCGAETAWVARSNASVEGPARVRGVAVGRCGYVEGREGKWLAHVVELYVYDAQGRLALVVGPARVEGYRWVDDAGKPMLAGGRSFLPWQSTIVDARKRAAVAAK